MTITEERGALRVALRTFIREVKNPPFFKKEELVQARVLTELNAVLAGFSTVEEKITALSNFKAIKADFINFLNVNFSSVFGELCSGASIEPYLKTGVKEIMADLQSQVVVEE